MENLRRRSLRKKYLRQRILITSIILITGFFLLTFIFSLIIFAWYAKDLPSPSKLASSTSASTVFLDKDGKILFEIYKDKNRIPISLNQIPDYLKKATIAIEDKNFYKHSGISQTGILRAFINITLGKGLQGGSTITQQLIKNVILGPERSLSRKIKEMILALEVERRYTKDEILQMYLNEAPYGGTFWGVGSAAKGYFGKEVKDLNLVEAAFLAGLPQSPSIYSPFIGKNDLWKKRTIDVLRRMREDGYITKNQEKRAIDDLEKLKFTTLKLAINAPHFVFYVKDQIEKKFGAKLLDTGVKISTTLSLKVQEIAQKIVKEEIEKLKKYNVTNGAVVVLDAKTGNILAMVGSYDYNDKKYGNFNAALGLRQPGSTVKPITYAVAFEKGYTPSTVIMDVKTEFTSGNPNEKPYIPENYDGKFRGPIQIRFALGNSINIPAVKMLAMIGIKDFLQKAYDMGLTQFAPNEENLKRFGLSITLGGGETTLLDLTSAFSVFANGGVKKEINAFTEIKDYKNKIIFKQVRDSENKIISPEVAFLISHILSDNNARIDVFGPNSYLKIPGKTVAVKTGTSDDKRDNWAVGYTKDIVVGVWVGNNDNSKMDPRIASGATGASPIFYRLMVELLKVYKDGIPEKPEKVKALTIDAFLGGLPKEGYPTRSEYFIEGTEPKSTSSFYKTLKISKNNGKLANEIEIKTGNYEEKEFVVITENDPLSTDGRNRWQEAIDQWSSQQADEKFKPPKEISDVAAEDVIVSIKSPSDKSQFASETTMVELKAKLTSLYPIKSIKIYLNDKLIKTIEGDVREIDENINIEKPAAYELKIEALNEKGKTGSSSIKFGIGIPWDYQPSPTMIPTIVTPTISST
ncbi:MAG: transglycosylase domain-containing protein [Microgenomates group bacterium]